jgi:hypothetical protein
VTRPASEARGGLLLALAVLLAHAPAATAAEEEGPWRLEKAVSAPAWLELGGSYRLRYEALSSHVRPGVEGADEILVSRLLLAARVGDDDLYARVELQDSRAWRDDEDTPLGTDDVNAAEILQAHVGLGFDDVLAVGDRLDVQAGRMTVDLGSRRLLARNRFRNTLNGFTGVHGAWRGPGEGSLAFRAFFLFPNDRLPSARARLDDHDVELDRDDTSLRFWGLHLGLQLADPRLGPDLRGELYVLGLDEEDRPSAPTRNRDFVTAGARLYRPPSRVRWDFEVEAAIQVGESRASASPAATRDLDRELDHQAWFAHVHAGRTFGGRTSPRLVFQYDYASGDDLPGDDENNRFDTLFGARRFELGPTGIFGLLARSNVSSPGTRIELSPGAGRQLMVAYRAAWLASGRDALTTNGVRDPTGASGSFVGHLVEARFRVSPLSGNLGLELGAAHLFAGELLREASTVEDSTYGYAQTTFTF